MTAAIPTESGYSPVNGLEMYYEIHGQGKPLVLIHGGGSTLQTSFGRIIPHLARNRQVIAVELQAHGRTGDRDTPLSFAQDADDVAALLKNLHLPKADFLGFSNGGQTALEIALRHPALVDRLILASMFYKRSAVVPQFWEGFDHVTLNDMPAVLKEGFLAVNNDPEQLLNMFNRDVQRMKAFEGWSDEQLRSVKATALVIHGTMDVCSVEHAVEMYRLIPSCELAVFPGGHGAYLGTLESLGNNRMPAFNAIALVEEFLGEDSSSPHPQP